MPKLKRQRRGRVKGRRSRRASSSRRFTRPFGGKGARRVAGAQASMEFNPQIRERRNQARGSAAREADLGRWYKELAADYGASSDASLKAFSEAQKGVERQSSDASARGQASLKKLASEDASFAKLVGGPTNAGGLSKIAEAAAASDRHRATLNAPLAATSAANITRLGSRRVSARLRGVEATGAERDRRKDLRSEIGSLRREKGRAKATKINELRKGEREYVTQLKQLKLARREARSAEQRAAADAAIAQVESARRAQSDATSSRQGQERIGISRGQLGVSRRNARTAEKGLKKRGGLTSSQKLSAKQRNRDATATARTLLGIRRPRSEKEWAKFQAALQERLGSSYGAEARRAVARLRRQIRQGNRGVRGATPVPYAPTKRGRKAARRARKRR